MKTELKNRSLNVSKILLFIHDIALLPRKVHVIVFSLSLALSTRVMAAGVTGFFTGWKSAITALIDLVLLGGMAIGIIAVLYGFTQMIKKGMGRGDDVEWSKIIWPVIGGALATILLYVIQAVVEEGGASRADMGRNQ